MRTALLVLIMMLVFLLTMSGQTSGDNYNNKRQGLSLKTDSIIINEGYVVSFHQVTDDKKFAELHEAHQLYNPTMPQVITRFDSAMIFLKSDKKIRFEPFDWADENNRYEYIKVITCRNGMKLIFRDLVSFERYYPDEDVMVLSNGIKRVINLGTGEDEYNPQYLRYSQNQYFRTVLLSGNDDVQRLKLQFYDKKQKCYRTLIHLYELNGQSGFNADDYFWKGDALYLLVNNDWVEIRAEKDDKKERKDE